ncbi:proto-oncogene tyrosine-protein kinase receptor Ret-like [Branchiostoma floridae]|uniref:Proto-oncogene tyrosine-protein kinase receptor Ret-like n=2 Tax=Branchiostoma floridae TaxID=7739 RepID=A0A9J7MWQ1_BRAFL|nr:proto-oncogene tyrosine-protein kinase receptor Ret-like [Branchiostoma floridae]
MKTVTVLFFVIVCLLVYTNWTNGEVNLSAKIAENGDIGEEVIRVLPTTPGGKEEVPCDIIEGNVHGRFSVTHYCVIVVARPLDFSINQRYNLTVNVPGTTETRLVNIQVEDVDGYPPIYNDICEMPVLANDRAPVPLAFNVAVTAEYMGKSGELFILKADTKKYLQPGSQEITMYTMAQIYASGDCHAVFVVGVHHANDLRTVNGLWLSYNRCFQCFDPLDSEHFFQIRIIHDDYISCDFSSGLDSTIIDRARQSYVWNKYKFKLLIHSKLRSTEKHRFVCKIPQRRPISVLTRQNHAYDEILMTRLETEIQPVGCPPNKYGLACEQNCTCENGARCHGLNGACKCQPGWKGVVCDIPHSTVAIIANPSDSRQIHIRGSLTLHCKSFHLAVEKMVWTFPNGTRRRLRGTQEDQIRIESIQSEHNGTYSCTVITEDETEVHARYELQAVNCPPNKRGELCEDDCNCLHGASCDRWASCVCPPGWTGNICETKCPDGTYGRGCSGECPCQNGAICDPSDGQCNCTEGWYGMHCTRPCLSGRYGWRCRQACDCKNNATCYHVDGSCTCAPPWTGQQCDVIQTEPSLLPLQIFIPLSLTLLGVLAALVALYKWRAATRMRQDEDQEEIQVLLELKSMEENLAQSLQPGWLKRWERKAKDLTLGDLIGQGAFSFIREGRLRTANADVTVVAVKSVRSKDRLCYRAFYREAAMLVALDENCEENNPDGHPNIIKFLGVITKSTPKCILLEYAAKGDLLQLLKQQNTNNVACLVGSFLRYAVHISRALKELRRLRIAHGDVAARNILISGDDVAKLSDFGLAHDVYTTTTYISSGKNDAEELLPLKWMALESLETRKFTCESDTWSFGVLLWEIAAFGEEPDYQHEIRLSCPRLVGILRQGYRLQKPPGCPDRLYDVMKSCWQEDPSARPEPAELEQKLTDCREEIDPLFVIEKVTTL